MKERTRVFDSDRRDVDETISWIKEKEQLMASDDFGRDLASVQALLRKHEGLERDLAALEDKARTTSPLKKKCLLNSTSHSYESDRECAHSLGLSDEPIRFWLSEVKV